MPQSYSCPTLLLQLLLHLGIGATACACEANAPLHTAVRPQPQDWNEWRNKHRRLVQRARDRQARLVFLGDSITENWTSVGHQTWHQYYAPRKAANLGIAGDRTQHVLWRIQEGHLEELEPIVVVLLVGTNNLKEQRNTVKETAEGIAAVVDALVTRLPQTTVLLLGVLPCGETAASRQRSDAEAVNQRLSETVDQRRVVFLDVSDKLMEDDGTISQEIMRDYLHLTARGYEVLAAAIEPALEKHFPSPPQRQVFSQ